MNSCILMAQIVEEPQLRFTPDQLALAEMLVQFPGLRAEDPPATLKVVGWGNLAQEIQQNYHQGDRVIIEGRLNMNTFERQEGFKEKRAELTVQRIHSLGDGVNINSSATVDVATSSVNVPRASESSRPPRNEERQQHQPLAAEDVSLGARIEEGVNARSSELPRHPIATPSPVSADTPSYQSSKPQSPAYTVPLIEPPDMDDIPF